MRYLTAINLKSSLALLAIIALFMGCKKNKDDEATPSGSNLPTSFQISIDEPFSPKCIDEDNEQNTYILGTDFDITKLYKLNKDGDLVWSKDYQNISGKISKLQCLNDNSLIVLSYEEEILEPIDMNLFSGYVETNVLDNNCNQIFESGYSEAYNVKGKTYLTKIDSAGNFEWSKEFDESYTGNHSIVNYPNNKFLLVTMKLKGKDPELVISDDGFFLDTIRYSLNENSINLYNISSDGNINWEKQFDNIYNKEFDKVSPNIDVMASNHNITIKTAKELMFLDYQGNEIDNLDIYPEHCTNELCTMLGTSNNRILISGMYSTYNQQPNGYNEYSYTKLIDQSGNELWQTDSYAYIIDISKQRLDNYQCFAHFNDSKITMSDINGNILWSIDENSYIPPESVFINSDLGITYTTYTYGSPIVITKTNSEGIVD